MRRPDVALLSVYPPVGDLHGGTSGVASYTANLARALHGAGVDVTVVAPRAAASDPRTHTDDGVLVRRCGSDESASLEEAVAVAAELHPRVVHVQHEWFLWGGPGTWPSQARALRRLRARTAPPTVATVHQVVLPQHVDRTFTDLHGLPPVPAAIGQAFRAAQSAMRQQVDRVIVHEPAFTQAVRDATVIHHGLEPGSAQPRDDARRQVGLDERFAALQFGFVAPYKGLTHGLHAIEAAGPEVHGVVAGGPHPRHGDGLLRHLSARFGHTATFTGFVADEDVAAWFRAADVALLLYPRPHASSGVLALALAHGCPVLVSPALADTIDAPAELVVEPDVLAVSRRLRTLAADPAARRRLHEAAGVLAAGRQWSDVARRHAHLYEELTCERAGDEGTRPFSCQSGWGEARAPRKALTREWTSEERGRTFSTSIRMGRGTSPMKG